MPSTLIHPIQIDGQEHRLFLGASQDHVVIQCIDEAVYAATFSLFRWSTIDEALAWLHSAPNLAFRSFHDDLSMTMGFGGPCAFVIGLLPYSIFLGYQGSETFQSGTTTLEEFYGLEKALSIVRKQMSEDEKQIYHVPVEDSTAYLVDNGCFLDRIQKNFCEIALLNDLKVLKTTDYPVYQSLQYVNGSTVLQFDLDRRDGYIDVRYGHASTIDENGTLRQPAAKNFASYRSVTSLLRADGISIPQSKRGLFQPGELEKAIDHLIAGIERHSNEIFGINPP